MFGKKILTMIQIYDRIANRVKFIFAKNKDNDD